MGGRHEDRRCEMQRGGSGFRCAAADAQGWRNAFGPSGRQPPYPGPHQRLVTWLVCLESVESCVCPMHPCMVADDSVAKAKVSCCVCAWRGVEGKPMNYWHAFRLFSRLRRVCVKLG